MKLNKLKGKRVERGFTQEDLAKELRITSMTYRRKEKGDREFLVSEAYSLSQILKLSLQEVNDIFFENTLT